MRKNSSSELAFFNPRIFAAFLLCSAGGWLAMLSLASTPSSGTLSATSPILAYDAGPFAGANATPILLVDSGPRCNSTSNPCDSYALTLSLPSGYVSQHPNASVKVTMYWNDTGSGASDYDLYVFKGVVGNTSGGQSAD